MPRELGHEAGALGNPAFAALLPVTEVAVGCAIMPDANLAGPVVEAPSSTGPVGACSLVASPSSDHCFAAAVADELGN